MPLLPRFSDTRLEDERKIARIILDGGEAEPVKTPRRQLAKPGDPRVMRAIPIIARGVGGTIPGTEGCAAYLVLEARAGR